MDGRAPCSQRVCVCVCAHGLCALEHVHMLLLLASVCCREGCIDGRGASFAVSAVEVLKASGPQRWAMSQSPILVTYGPAMTNPQGLVLWVWAWGVGI